MNPTPASTDTGSEVAQRADFQRIRYAQCWEDADVLLAGLDIHPGDTCLSIASAGDNTLSLLTADPARVIAIDLNPAQLHCLRLRIAAYRSLSHGELLELIGSRPASGEARLALYHRCREALDEPEAQRFWDAQPELIRGGIGDAGKFERYFALFRRYCLPWVHGRRRIGRLLAGGTRDQRIAFYQRHWNTWRWRLLFRVFFSRFVMARLGRDPAFFRYVEGSVAERILRRVEHALTELNPAENPYLHWILKARHGHALPHALRSEHFEAIRDRLDRVTIRQASLEQALAEFAAPPRDHAPDRVAVNRFNLSDIFEYMSEANTAALLSRCLDAAAPGARLVYWNMLAPRSRPESLAHRLQPLPELAVDLHHRDKAFFYSQLVVEEVMA